MRITDVFPALGQPSVTGSNVNPSATRRGPGRRHKAGHKKLSPPRAKGGAGFGHAQLTASERKRFMRKAKRQIGARQARRHPDFGRTSYMLWRTADDYAKQGPRRHPGP